MGLAVRERGLVVAEVAANLAIVVASIALDWTALTLLLIYWCETLILGACAAARALAAPLGGGERPWYAQGVLFLGARLFPVGFVGIGLSVFAAGQLILLETAFLRPRPPGLDLADPMSGVRALPVLAPTLLQPPLVACLLGLLVSHAMAQWRAFVRSRGEIPDDFPLVVIKRVVFLQVTLFFFGWAVRSTAGAAIWLSLFKLGCALFMLRRDLRSGDPPLQAQGQAEPGDAG